MRLPQRLLAGCLTSVLCVGGSPHAAAQAPPSPSPSPSTPEERARDVERENLEEDAPSTEPEAPPETPEPSVPEFVGPPVPPPDPPSPSPEPSPAEEPPVPSPEPFPTAPPTPDPAPLGPTLEPSPDAEAPPSPEPSPSPAASPAPSPDPSPPPSPEATPTPTPSPSPSPSPLPPLAPPDASPSPSPSPEPAADGESSDNPTVLDKIGTFQDIEDIDLGDLLAVRSGGEGGSRTADDEPGTVYVLTEEDIRRSGARGLHEVLETVPGLEIVTDNLGRGRVIVRGVPAALTSGGSENLLVLLNGLKLNENVTGGAFAVNLDLPVDNIKRIEVVRGPGSVLYGAGAFLGVINIVTESVDTFRRDELTLGGGSFRSFLYNFRYGTTIREVSLAGFLQYAYTGGARLDVPGDLQGRTDGALAPLGIAPATRAPGETVDDRKAADANLALAYRDFGLNIRMKKEDSGGFVGLLDVLGRQNRLTNTQLGLAGHWARTLPAGDAAVKVAFSQSEVARFLDVLPPGFTLVPADRVQVRFPGGVAFQDSLGTRRVGAEGTLTRVVSARHTVTGGARLEREATFDLSAKSNFDFEAARPLPGYQELPALVPEASRTVASLFAQDAWSPTDRLGITAGARLDRYTDFGATLNPRLAGVYRARPDLNFKVAYGRAVRSPSFLELFYSSPRTIANPDLDPARIHSLDAAVIFRRRERRISATVFQTSLRDVIVPSGTGLELGSRALIVNAEGIDTRGIEIEGSRTFAGSRTVYVAYTLQRPEDKATGLRLPDVPTHLGRIAGIFPAGEYLLVSPSLTFRSGRPRASGDTRPDLDGYTLVDLVVRGRNFHPRLEVAGSVHNLFDTRYADPSPLRGLPGDYPRPGRAVFVKLKYRF
jgi:iron complex outermembrane receptor protein